MRFPTGWEFDDWWPRAVRVCGLLLTFVLVGFCLAGHYVEAAPGFVAATGMMLYKSVRDGARNGNGNGNGNGRSKDLSDW